MDSGMSIKRWISNDAWEAMYHEAVAAKGNLRVIILRMEGIVTLMLWSKQWSTSLIGLQFIVKLRSMYLHVLLVRTSSLIDKRLLGLLHPLPILDSISRLSLYSSIGEDWG